MVAKAEPSRLGSRHRSDLPRVALISASSTVHLWRWASVASNYARLTVFDYGPVESSYDFTQLGEYVYLPLGKPWGAAAKNFLALRRRLHDFDCLNFHSVNIKAPALALRQPGRQILSFWGSDALVTYAGARGPMKLLYERALAGADVVTYNSIPVGRALSSYESKLRRVNWPIETDVYTPPGSEDDVAEAKASLGLPRNELVLLSTRAVKPLYRIDRVIEMCRPALSKGGATLIIHVPPNPSPEYLARCRTISAGLPVRFSEADLDAEGLARLYRMADVYITAARSDSFPSSVVEALCCGCAVVAAADTAPYLDLAQELPLTLLPPGATDPAILEDLRRPVAARQLAAESVAPRFDPRFFSQQVAELYAPG